MDDYLAAGVCPKCKRVNVTDMKGAKVGFIKEDGVVKIKCAECNNAFTLKTNDVAYWKAK
jgi:phage FluMu protein Com